MIPITDKIKLKKPPYITILLILINIVLFFLFTTEEYFLKFGFVPGNFNIVNIFTSLFLHANLFHLFINVWFLWIFGSSIEIRLGKVKFLYFYLLCGMLANLAYFFLSSINVMIPLIGASGAISGVLAAYLVLYPKSRIKTFPDFNLPAFLYIILWFFLQLLFTVLGGGSFLIHASGFIIGIILIIFFKDV